MDSTVQTLLNTVTGNTPYRNSIANYNNAVADSLNQQNNQPKDNTVLYVVVAIIFLLFIAFIIAMAMRAKKAVK